MRDLPRAASEQGTLVAQSHYRLFKWWFAFGLPAVAAVLATFLLMITQPEFAL